MTDNEKHNLAGAVLELILVSAGKIIIFLIKRM